MIYYIIKYILNINLIFKKKFINNHEISHKVKYEINNYQYVN